MLFATSFLLNVTLFYHIFFSIIHCPFLVLDILHWYGCMFFLPYFFISRTFHIYIYIYTYFICVFLLYFFSLSILRQKEGDITWIDSVVLACMGCTLILIFYYFSPLSWFNYLTYIFFHTLFYHGHSCVWYVQVTNVGILLFLDASHHSLHVIGWLGLDEWSKGCVNFIWEFWRVYVFLCFSQNCEKRRLLWHFYVLTILFLFILV